MSRITVEIKMERCFLYKDLPNPKRDIWARQCSPLVTSTLPLTITSDALAHSLAMDRSAAILPYGHLHNQCKTVIYYIRKYFLGEQAGELWRNGNSQWAAAKQGVHKSGHINVQPLYINITWRTEMCPKFIYFFSFKWRTYKAKTSQYLSIQNV